MIHICANQPQSVQIISASQGGIGSIVFKITKSSYFSHRANDTIAIAAAPVNHPMRVYQWQNYYDIAFLNKSLCFMGIHCTSNRG